MKAIYTLLILLSLSLVSQAQLNGEITQIFIPAPSLSNNLFGDRTSRPISIYLPPSYHDVDYAFPVLYFLGGAGFGPVCGGIWYNGVTEYDNRLSQDNLEEMIVVYIPGCNMFGASYYVNSSATGNWEDFIRYDVVNYIDSNYRTIRKNQCRGIAGQSMGGFGAISLAMRNPDIFNSVYASSPAVHDNNMLTEVFHLNEESYVRDFINFMDSLKAKDLESALNDLNDLFIVTNSPPVHIRSWTSYGSAFCPDPTGPAPFLKFPYSLDENQNLIRNDSIANIWLGGYGQWDRKTELFSDNLSSLDTLIMIYGDEEPSYRENGIEFIHNALNQHGIENSILIRAGGHTNFVPSLHTQMYPAMSITLWRDSSRFRTGTEILSIEVENQVQEAIIDSGNGTIEAFVSDTTNMEAIRLHITFSDGAWETPMANQELDFSWGPITFRVTSGNGQNNKVWTVTITQVSTSNIDLIDVSELSIFPNPTSGIINISGLTQPAEVKIYSIQGQLLKSDHQVENTIDLSDLPAGVYFMNLSSGDTVLKKSIVKR